MPRATPDQLKNFAAKLREEMRVADITDTELGEAAGVSRQAIINYLAGIREPRPHVLEAIERRLQSGGRLAEALIGEVRLSASGTPLEELAELDPEGFEEVQALARLLLRRARERKGRKR